MILARQHAPELTALLRRFHLNIHWVPLNQPIPGSFWGESEAGLIGDSLYVRYDTPLHSALHESAHFICMDPSRRRSLHTDAGGSDLEESAVCFLQILLANELSINPAEFLANMDRWGYSFRLGSARAWFEQDSSDAGAWLNDHGLINQDRAISYQLNILDS